MQHPEQGVHLRCGAYTSTGQVRDNNEDSIHLWTYEDSVALAIVADGMGGAVAGEEASRIAVETIQAGLVSSYNDIDYSDQSEYDLSALIKQAIRNANNEIVLQASDQPELKGMGTTVTMAFVRATHVILGHVGDSRAYLVDGQDGRIVQLTYDHSFVQALIAAGHITEEEALDHPMRNVLYRALGQAGDIEIDIYYEHLHVGDWLLLCSDGLTLHLSPKEIAGIVTTAGDPEAICRQLVNLTNERGGRDNISVIVIKVETPQNYLQLEREMPRTIYDDEDTLMPANPDYPASSESGEHHRQEQRDTRTGHREPPGLFGDKASPTVSTGDDTSDEDDPPADGGTLNERILGEGSDTLPPNQ